MKFIALLVVLDDLDVLLLIWLGLDLLDLEMFGMKFFVFSRICVYEKCWKKEYLSTLFFILHSTTSWLTPSKKA